MAETTAIPEQNTEPKATLDDFLNYQKSGGGATQSAKKEEPTDTETTSANSPFDTAQKFNPMFTPGGPGIKDGISGFTPPENKEEAGPAPSVDQNSATADVLITLYDIALANACMVLAQENNSKHYRFSKDDKQEIKEVLIPFIAERNYQLPTWVPLAIILIVVSANRVQRALSERNRKKRNMEGRKPETTETEEDLEVVEAVDDDQRTFELQQILQKIQHEAGMKGWPTDQIFQNWDIPPAGCCRYHWYILGLEVKTPPGKQYAADETGSVKRYSSVFNGLKSKYMAEGLPWLPDYDPLVAKK